MITLRSANEHFRYTFKQGMSGWDVMALQVALNTHYPSPKLVVDGAYGPATQAVVTDIQRDMGILTDGIAGPETQSRFMAAKCAAANAFVPKGLMKGICFGESGGIIPCTSTLYPDGTRDYGPLQDNMSASSSEEAITSAFNPVIQVKRVAQLLRQAYDRFHMIAPGSDEERLWHLAVLSYNWPAAAQALAEGRTETWTYIESDTGRRRRLTDLAPWVQAYAIPGVNSGADWCDYYVASKTVYVSSWTVR